MLDEYTVLGYSTNFRSHPHKMNLRYNTPPLGIVDGKKEKEVGEEIERKKKKKLAKLASYG